MSSFRYAQELRRTIRLFGSFAVAFSFISITTGIFANYKSLMTDSGPVGIWTWPLVAGGQLLLGVGQPGRLGRWEPQQDGSEKDTGESHQKDSSLQRGWELATKKEA